MSSGECYASCCRKVGVKINNCNFFDILERKPDAQTNWDATKSFFLKSLGPKPKNFNNNKSQKGKKKQQTGKQNKKQDSGKTKKKLTCFVCGKQGHIASKCEKLKKYKAAEKEAAGSSQSSS